MLIKVTNKCSMGCSHCMEDATPEGTDMSLETFAKALEFSEGLEALAPVRMTMLSGGEPTDHPDILELIKMAEAPGHFISLLTNGLWLEDEGLRDEILSHKLAIQVTNDSRFYPEKHPLFEHPAITYVDSLSVMFPMGRFAGKESGEVPTRKAPTCFNLRSLTRNLLSVRHAVAQLRMRALKAPIGGWCIPSINVDGTVVVGESNGCHSIGTVNSTHEELTQAIIDMKCDRCGLVENLPQELKRAIGESSLFLSHEFSGGIK